MEIQMTKLTADEVRRCIMEWPGLYESEDGCEFLGMPMSEVPQQLRACRWRSVPRLNASDLARMGLQVARARYVGGVRPKRYCDVVVADLFTPSFSDYVGGRIAPRQVDCGMVL